jgi:hypothetical protein
VTKEHKSGFHKLPLRPIELGLGIVEGIFFRISRDTLSIYRLSIVDSESKRGSFASEERFLLLLSEYKEGAIDSR